jgi:quercetin dioxygenase-like cupin family protein
VRSWRLPEIETPDGSRSPVVLHSADEGRAVLIGLLPGQKLGDHQVKEHAILVIVDGTAQIESAGETLDAGVGTMVAFDPDERHIVASDSGAKILLMLAPWPGDGHYRGDPVL